MQVTKSITKRLEENNENFGDLRVHIEDNKIIRFRLHQFSNEQARKLWDSPIDPVGLFIKEHPNTVEFLKYVRNTIDKVLKEIGEE